jgi:hypothetical protein
MDAIERLVNTENLRTSRLLDNLENAKNKFLYYDPISDILFLSIVPPDVETVVHYIDDYVGLLYEPDSLEVVGFQVEAFEHSFMPMHDEVKAVWKLSAAEVKLRDIGEFIVVFERKKEAIARELKGITERLLGGEASMLVLT